MKFENLNYLWGLLLGLLPIFIHLFNRLRHRKLPWAAMMFLRMANRKSTKYAKVRQWLVLLFRMLAVMALVFALSRPSLGGLFKGMVSGEPEVIMILVDRSASMGAKIGEQNRLERALEVMIDSAKAYGKGVRLVVMEHTDKGPREVGGGVGALANVISKEVTDTAADIPGMLEESAVWFEENSPGIGEIWVASDMQSSNWNPSASERWSKLSTKLEGLSQSVRVRLLSMGEEVPENVSVRIVSAARQRIAERTDLVLKLEFGREDRRSAEVELAVFVEGKENAETIKLEGETYIHEFRYPLRKGEQSGWGYVELVDREDGNPRDNSAYFIYGEPIKAQTAVVGNPELFATKFLKLAAAPDSSNTNQVSKVVSPTSLETIDWTDYAMVLWQGKLPEAADAEKLTDYVKAGGLVVCFPVEKDDDVRFNGLGWGGLKKFETDGKEFGNWQELVAAEKEQEQLGFRITSYTDNEGPLQKTEEGLYLPVGDLRVNQRKAIMGDGAIQASFGDGVPWLMSKAVGKGQVVFCGTQPSDKWSSLTEGLVLVPMLQRMLSEGEAMMSGRFAQGRILSCGVDKASEGERWVPEEAGSNAVKDFNSQAGIYRMGQRVVAVNRPSGEDITPRLEDDKVGELFGEVPVALVQDKSSEGGGGDFKEIWQWFLVAMALALLIEGILILPKGADERVEIQTAASGKVSSREGA